MRKELEKYLNNDKVKKALDMISYAEGTYNSKDPYNTLVGGGIIGENGNLPFQKTPFNYIDKEGNKRSDLSSATGKYQFLEKTWKNINDKYKLDGNLSPKNQDLAAIALIKENNALEDILSSDYTKAFKKLNKTWASLEGSPYGQKTIKTQELLNKFRINNSNDDDGEEGFYFIDNNKNAIIPKNSLENKLINKISQNNKLNDNKKSILGGILKYTSNQLHPSDLKEIEKRYEDGEDILISLKKILMKTL